MTIVSRAERSARTHCACAMGSRRGAPQTRDPLPGWTGLLAPGSAARSPPQAQPGSLALRRIPWRKELTELWVDLEARLGLGTDFVDRDLRGDFQGRRHDAHGNRPEGHGFRRP